MSRNSKTLPSRLICVPPRRGKHWAFSDLGPWSRLSTLLICVVAFLTEYEERKDLQHSFRSCVVIQFLHHPISTRLLHIPQHGLSKVPRRDDLSHRQPMHPIIEVVTSIDEDEDAATTAWRILERPPVTPSLATYAAINGQICPRPSISYIIHHKHFACTQKYWSIYLFQLAGLAFWYCGALTLYLQPCPETVGLRE